MFFRIEVWPEAMEQFKQLALHESCPAEGDVTMSAKVFEQLSDRFDLMIRTRNGVKYLHVSPLGRGFGQRG